MQEDLQNFVDVSLEMNSNTPTKRKTKLSSELVYGSPVKELVTLSQSGAYDLIVMGTAGERSFGEIVFGSVSTHVSQQAFCPVLMVPKNHSFTKVKRYFIRL